MFSFKILLSSILLLNTVFWHVSFNKVRILPLCYVAILGTFRCLSVHFCIHIAKYPCVSKGIQLYSVVRLCDYSASVTVSTAGGEYKVSVEFVILQRYWFPLASVTTSADAIASVLEVSLSISLNTALPTAHICH